MFLYKNNINMFLKNISILLSFLNVEKKYGENLKKQPAKLYLCVVLRNARGGIGRRATLRG
jgi:sulfur relay (sulfurtransferase) complex TusBCD TusD component (DsrE family)